MQSCNTAHNTAYLKELEPELELVQVLELELEPVQELELELVQELELGLELLWKLIILHLN